MSVIDRYVIREMLVPFAQALGFLLVLMVFGQLLKLADQFSSLGLSATSIFKAIMFSFAPALGVLLPLSLLLASILAFGRMAADGELTALSASGISFIRLLVAPLVLGIMVSGLSFGISVWGEPWGIRSLQRLLAQAVKESLSQGMQPKTFYSWLPGIMLYTGERDGKVNKFKQLVFIDTRNKGHEMAISAERAELLPVRGKSSLLFHLKRGNVLVFGKDKLTRINFNENRYRLDLGAISRRGEGFFTNRQGMTLSELYSLSKNPKVSKGDRGAYRTALHKKFSLPLAAIIFALLGGLLSSYRSRSNFAIGLIMGVVVVGIYYYIMRTGELSAMRGRMIPWVAIWSPNILFAFITIGVGIHRSRYASG